MFSSPSSTTAIDNCSSSPTSSDYRKAVENTSVAISPTITGDSESEKGYTILVPANVRFRGMNMHFDLQIDQNALVAASKKQNIAEEVGSSLFRDSLGSESESKTIAPLSKSAETTRLSFSISSRSDSSNAASLHTPSTLHNNRKRDISSSPLIMDATVGEGESASMTSIDEFKPQGVSSTTAEQATAIYEASDESQSSSDPVSSSVYNSNDDVIAAADTTTVTTTAVKLTEATSTSFSKTDSNTTATSSVTPTLQVTKSIRGENGGVEERPSSCVPSSSTHLPSDDLQDDGDNGDENAGGTASQSDDQDDCLETATAADTSFHEDELTLLVHDNQPCSSTNILQFHISSTNSNNTTEELLETSGGDGLTVADKNSDYIPCTNAIRMDREEIFCSTHLIMKGIKKPKKKIGQANSDMGDGKTFAENSSALQIDALESSSKSTAYVLDAPSSFEFGATPYRADSVGNSRGCESTGSWDQASTASGSITPSHNTFYQSTNFQQQSFVNNDHNATLDHRPPPSSPYFSVYDNRFAQQQRSQQYSYVNNNVQAVTTDGSNNSSPQAQSLGAVAGQPLSMGFDSSRQIPRQTQSLAGPGLRSETVSSPLSYDGMLEQQQEQYFSTSCGDRRQEASAGTAQTQLQQQQSIAHARNYANCTNQQQSISRLSKQHPQLAAKLLQPLASNIPLTNGSSSIMLSDGHGPETVVSPLMKNDGALLSTTAPGVVPYKTTGDGATTIITPPAVKRGRRPRAAKNTGEMLPPPLPSLSIYGIGPATATSSPAMTSPPSSSSLTPLQQQQFGNQYLTTQQKHFQQQHGLVMRSGGSRVGCNVPPSYYIHQGERYATATTAGTQQQLSYLSHPQQYQTLNGNMVTAARYLNGAPMGGNGGYPQLTSSMPIAFLHQYGSTTVQQQIPVGNHAQLYQQYPQQQVLSNGYQIHNSSSVAHHQQQGIVSQQSHHSLIHQSLPTSRAMTVPSNGNVVKRALSEAIAPQVSSPLSFIGSEPPPVKYKLWDITVAGDEQSASGSSGYCRGEADSQRPQKVKLRQKRQKIRIRGKFRDVPVVDSMCKIIEAHDFDSTDLFPLGLEPSDDEVSSDDSFPCFFNEWLTSAKSAYANARTEVAGDATDRKSDNNKELKLSSNPDDNSLPYLPQQSINDRVQLYLLKKQLRLESLRLVSRAKISVPIIQAAKSYANCVGAALRTRQMNSRRETIGGVERSRMRLCLHVNSQEDSTKSDGDRQRENILCDRVCLPLTNYCAEHVLMNGGGEQKLFAVCKRRGCSRSVLCVDAAALNGLCRRHYDEENISAHQRDVLAKRPPGFSHLSNAAEVNSVPMGADQLYDDEGDVSLASVAKDLGFDGRELTDMLERMPVDESLGGNEDMEGFLDGIKIDDAVSGVDLGHAWEDVEQFLRSEGCYGDNSVAAYQQQQQSVVGFVHGSAELKNGTVNNCEAVRILQQHQIQSTPSSVQF